MRNPFRAKDAGINQDVKGNLIITGANAELTSGPTEADIAMQQALGVRNEVIHDPVEEDLLTARCWVPRFQPSVDDKGHVKYVKDKNGDLVRDGNNNPLPVYEQVLMIDNAFAALRTMASHTMGCHFLDPANSRLVLLEAEDVIETSKMIKPESDLELGTGVYFEALYAKIMLLLNDSVNGNKLKSLLEVSTRKTLEHYIANQKEKKGLL